MKKFIIKTLIIALPFTLLMVGETSYYAIWVKPYMTRDLSRLGMIAFSIDYEIQCPKGEADRTNIPIDSLQPTNSETILWVFGDSFSQKDSWKGYVDFMGVNYVSQYVVATNQDSPFQSFVSLYNTNTKMPKHIILESVERSLVGRLCNIDFACDTVPLQVKYETKRSKNICEQAHECFKKRIGIGLTPVRKVSLQKSLFSCKDNEDKLFFLSDDLGSPSQMDIEKAINNLKRVYSLADKKGINLYVLIATDKYEIYRPYIVNNVYDEINWLDKFVKEANNARLVNSADTLRQMAANGVKDIYYCDDTHWSPIGAKAVAEYLSAKMNINQNPAGMKRRNK